MRIRKMTNPLIGQKRAREAVGNSTNFRWQKTHFEHRNPNFQFDPYLIAAIIKRNPSSIKSSVNPCHTDAEPRAILRESQHEALTDFYGKELLANPVKLALKICDSDTTETTHGNDPTRFDVLHCIAENFDSFVESARQKSHPVPDLKDILDYARGLNSHLPLHTFILGLSEERKEEAAKILHAQPITYDLSSRLQSQNN